MPELPQLEAAQRKAGWERSLEVRRARAHLKDLVARREVTFADAVGWEVAAGMKVKTLLLAVPYVGHGKASRWLREAGIPDTNTVQGCGLRQLGKLLARVPNYPRV